MKGFNQAIIMGNLGQDPEVRYMPNGGAAANISVATTDSWKDKQTGEKQERTEWHRIVAFGKLAEIMGEYLKKGSTVLIQGEIRTRKWEDKEGNTKYTTEILAREMQMIGGRPGNSGQSGNSAPSQAPASNDDFDDDIPF